MRWIAAVTLFSFSALATCPPAYAQQPQQYRTKVYYYHSDHLGSTNVVTDENGQVVQRIEYKPFGEPYLTVGQEVSPHKFTGKRLDDSTGLYFYESRYYDPQLGRFIQPDTIVPNPGDPQDLNRYTYARNNPLKYTDPTGHSWKSFFKKAWQAIVTVGAIAAAPFTAGQSLWAIAGLTVYNGAKAIQTGQFGAFAVGLAAGALTGWAASSFLAPALGGFFTSAAMGPALSALETGLITGIEFGLAGGAGGFAGTLAGGGSLSQAGKAAGVGFGVGFAIGGFAGYTYEAGYQSYVHGIDSHAVNANALQGAIGAGNVTGVRSILQESSFARTYAAELGRGKSYLLHFTDAVGKAGIEVGPPPGSLTPGSYATEPFAMVTRGLGAGKLAIELSPNQAVVATGARGGDFQVFIDRGQRGLRTVYQGETAGGLPESRLYGNTKVDFIQDNPN
ncbi:MAG: RHS domain-containing protein [Elusimicrobia bacterium]|nr:RHS domain-containing protein [Elusimicrobiota bacterium]